MAANDIGCSRRLVVVALLVVVTATAMQTGSVVAQEKTYDIKDLRLPVQSLHLPVDPLRFPVEDMTAPSAETAKETKFSLLGDVLFDFDKAKIRPRAEIVLGKIAVRIKKTFRRGSIRVEGHTDSKGSVSYNQKLSESRARSVRTWLVKEGRISVRRITAKGFGEKRPVAPNSKGGRDNPEGRQRNRRVEIIVRR